MTSVEAAAVIYSTKAELFVGPWTPSKHSPPSAMIEETATAQLSAQLSYSSSSVCVSW